MTVLAIGPALLWHYVHDIVSQWMLSTLATLSLHVEARHTPLTTLTRYRTDSNTKLYCPIPASLNPFSIDISWLIKHTWKTIPREIRLLVLNQPYSNNTILLSIQWNRDVFIAISIHTNFIKRIVSRRKTQGKWNKKQFKDKRQRRLVTRDRRTSRKGFVFTPYRATMLQQWRTMTALQRLHRPTTANIEYIGCPNKDNQAGDCVFLAKNWTTLFCFFFSPRTFFVRDN